MYIPSDTVSHINSIVCLQEGSMTKWYRYDGMINKGKMRADRDLFANGKFIDDYSHQITQVILLKVT